MRPNSLRQSNWFVPNETGASVLRVAVFLAGIVVASSVTLIASAAPAATPSARLTAGFAHTCMLTSSGAARCWGGNTIGELGNGSKSIYPAPTFVNVVGLKSGVRAIAAGGQHTCALTSVGKVKCWGRNVLGQLGKGTITPSGRTPVPVDVRGLGSGVRAIAVGGQHACALLSGGGVKCWGSDGQGQLGSGTRTLLFGAPVDVAGLASGVTAIGAGDSHTCGVAGGGVKCWGSNRGGELGNGLRVDSYSPVDVTGLTSGVSAVEPGDFHTCALTTGGGVKCWGENTFGQLGNGSSGQVLISMVPVDVVGLATGVTAIAAGRGHTCALTSAGGVKCWGLNQNGQLGNGSRTTSTTPVNVVGLTSGVTAIAAGYQHSCALMRSGGVKCWGSNFGRLGNGSQFNTKPVDVR